MSKKETVEERLERMKREKEAATAASNDKNDLVSQLTHESSVEPDFAKIAKQLEDRKANVAKGENEGHMKMTIYVREDIYRGFNALITKRGQQKEYVNQALADFIMKKARELELDK